MEGQVKKPKSPCRRDGKDCPLRKLGCRKTCPYGWGEFESAMKEYRAWREKQHAINDACFRDKSKRSQT